MPGAEVHRGFQARGGHEAPDVEPDDESKNLSELDEADDEADEIT